jgi:hypothetical protein
MIWSWFSDIYSLTSLRTQFALLYTSLAVRPETKILYTNFDIFTFHPHKIFKILVDGGYNRGKLIKNILRCLWKYNNVFRKFGILDDNNIIDELP